MNTDVETLLAEGMERFTAGVTAPAGLAGQAHRAARRGHRRRLTGTVAAAAATVTAAAIAVAGTAGGGGTGTATLRARTAAYVLTRVHQALTTRDLVEYGQLSGTDGRSSIWVYRDRSQFLEYFRGRPYSAEGSAIVHGRRMTVYVIYPDRKWMTDGQGWARPLKACRPHSAYQMNLGIMTGRWADYVSQMLACGGVTAAGHAVINGRETIKLTATPVTQRLPKGYSKVVHEKWDREGWTLYVDARTYLPVRLTGFDDSYGGPAAATHGTWTVDMRWLPATAASIARTLITVPAGFQQVDSAANI